MIGQGVKNCVAVAEKPFRPGWGVVDSFKGRRWKPSDDTERANRGEWLRQGAKRQARSARLVSPRIFRRGWIPGFVHEEKTVIDASTGEIVGESCYPVGEFRGSVTIGPGGATVKRSGSAYGRGKSSGGGKRGEILRFSEDSRRGLMRKMIFFPWDKYGSGSKKQKKSRAFFMTLTYADDFPVKWVYCEETGLSFQSMDFEACKKHLDIFRKRMIRGFKGVWKSLLWKMEIEPRKQGERKGMLAPHFHCILIFKEPVPLGQYKRRLSDGVYSVGSGIRATFSDMWAGVVKSGDVRHKAAGVSIDNIYARRGRGGVSRLMAYLGKYIGKEFEISGSQKIKIGRVWGVMKNTQSVETDAEKAELFPQETRGTFQTHDYFNWECFADNVNHWGKKSRFLRMFSPRSPGAMIYGSDKDLQRLVDGFVDAVEPLGYARKMLEKARDLKTWRTELVDLLSLKFSGVSCA